MDSYLREGLVSLISIALQETFSRRTDASKSYSAWLDSLIYDDMAEVTHLVCRELIQQRKFWYNQGYYRYRPTFKRSNVETLTWEVYEKTFHQPGSYFVEQLVQYLSWMLKGKLIVTTDFASALETSPQVLSRILDAQVLLWKIQESEIFQNQAVKLRGTELKLLERWIKMFQHDQVSEIVKSEKSLKRKIFLAKARGRLSQLIRSGQIKKIGRLASWLMRQAGKLKRTRRTSDV